MERVLCGGGALSPPSSSAPAHRHHHAAPCLQKSRCRRLAAAPRALATPTADSGPSGSSRSGSADAGRRQPGKRVGPIRGRGGGRGPRAEPERLAKVLARAGVASRRKAEELVFEGQVAVNGTVVVTPQTLVTPGKDKVTVRGRPVSISAAPELYYFAVNKPKGYLCASPSAAGGAEQRHTLVVDLFDDWLQRWKDRRPPGTLPPRLFTVGRLDVQSVGLLLVTNDGNWAQAVAHPSSGLTKEYLVTLDRAPTRAELEIVAAGCEVDGAVVTPEAVVVEDSDPHGKHRIRVVVAEGRNREVRVLVASAGLKVLHLKRVRVGGFRLPRDLMPGKFRALKPHEVRRVTNKGAQNLA